jgi:ATPase subunit of ABC transporter with duplicated ATPase domains
VSNFFQKTHPTTRCFCFVRNPSTPTTITTVARLLLSKPSLLLLDEPSNHLDSSARDWLGKYVAQYDGSVVLVSHDVALMDASVNSIAEITGNTLVEYRSCSYEKYLSEKEFRSMSAQAEYERNLEEAARLQAFVDKFGASATKAASAQSRVKMLEKMKREGKLDPPPLAVVAVGRKPELVLPNPPKPNGDVLLRIADASIGHDPNQEPLLENINLEITRGMKLLLRGPNGAGKAVSQCVRVLCVDSTHKTMMRVPFCKKMVRFVACVVALAHHSSFFNFICPISRQKYLAEGIARQSTPDATKR